ARNKSPADPPAADTTAGKHRTGPAHPPCGASTSSPPWNRSSCASLRSYQQVKHQSRHGRPTAPGHLSGDGGAENAARREDEFSEQGPGIVQSSVMGGLLAATSAGPEHAIP